jgi:hypothetical protein
MVWAFIFVMISTGVLAGQAAENERVNIRVQVQRPGTGAAESCVGLMALESERAQVRSSTNSVNCLRA